ncbi:MAG: DUF2161 family putative PD-(D/E)XK-type phosphodiesterase [Vallitalea sp.]|jgi:hypothetical protein|nr:DUF2161 family putative PD-(D/E)XK-type phosphodiesterase [Vallitalea sp.]
MNIKETDLYQPIHNYFTDLGYEVKSEVKSFDVTAVKDDSLVIIELKKNLNMKLLIQGTKAQRITDMVYIAIPRPKKTFSREWKDKLYLIRRLELGLIFISFEGNKDLVQVICHPKAFDRNRSMKRSSKKKTGIIAEIEGRYGDYNVGGSNRKKIMTAYKENCIHIACCLKKYGNLSTRELRKIGTGDKTTSILYNNYYNWFFKVSRGVYGLSEEGYKATEEHKELTQYYLKVIDN